MIHIESIIAGFLIGCAALLAQIGSSVIFEIFFNAPIPLHYTAHMSLPVFVFTMCAIVAIEEIIRFFCIVRKFPPHRHMLSLRDIFLHGILLGCGFALCEFLLSAPTIFTSPLPIFFVLWPLLIHCIASIVFLYTVCAHYAQKNFLIISVGGVIVFHVCANLLMFFVFN